MKNISKIAESKPFYLIVACIISVLLWLYVVNVENKDIDVQLTGIEVRYLGEESILRDRNLLVTDKDMQSVSMTLVGKRSVVAPLTREDVSVTVDLSDIRATGEYDKVYSVDFPEGVDAESILITKKNPQTMKVKIDNLVSKPVPISGDFDGSVAEGYMREPLVYEPDTVTVSGPEALVSRIEKAYVVVNRENLTKTVQGTVNYTLLDGDGVKVDSSELTADVQVVAYTIPIVMVRDVALAVDTIEGGGAKNRDVIIDIEPKFVTLSGDAAALEAINQLSLGRIDLASFAQSYSETFPIRLPNGVNNLSGEKEATVKISVKGLATKRIIATNIEFINVSEGYTAKAITQYKEVTVRGPQEIVDLIDAGNLRVVGDLSSIGNAVGRYSVPTQVFIDGYSEAGVVGYDYNVVVSLEQHDASALADDGRDGETG